MVKILQIPNSPLKYTEEEFNALSIDAQRHLATVGSWVEDNTKIKIHAEFIKIQNKVNEMWCFTTIISDKETNTDNIISSDLWAALNKYIKRYYPKINRTAFELIIVKNNPTSLDDDYDDESYLNDPDYPNRPQ